MKFLSRLIVLLIILLSVNSIYAQGDAEKAAKDIANAYKTKDAELLKKYVAGFFAMAINENFFDSEDGKPLVDVAKHWDGNVKEIRYSKGDLMGKEVLLASAYISDNANGNINVVILSSYERAEWKAFALGLSDSPKSEFKQGSLEIPKQGKSAEVKKTDHSEFSIEMANGDVFENPTTDKLKEQLNQLNDDNFYLILNSKDGFLQTSTSDKGYIVQYSDYDGMFEAEAYFTMDKLVEIFVAYIDNDKWKEKAKWLTM